MTKTGQCCYSTEKHLPRRRAETHRAADVRARLIGSEPACIFEAHATVGIGGCPTIGRFLRLGGVENVAIARVERYRQ